MMQASIDDSQCRSSLDRLKALSILPNLGAQLLEAQKLCTHGARAEMILKWLLERILSSPEARASSQSWDVLSLCLRTSSRRRIAAVLGANNIVEILRRTCAELNKTPETISAIASSLGLMLTLAESEDGAAIKSLLSIGDEVAAEICGSWFLRVYNSYRREEDRACILNENLLGPGIRLWELRRRTQAGDKFFTSNCLVPVLLLLEVLQRSTSLITSKRKRTGSTLLESRNIAWVLERLVAKHSIARFRAAFSERRRKTDDVVADYEPQQAQLSDLFEPLCRLPHGVEARQMAEVMPLALDIMIRSLKAPNPKARLRERPWTEAAFAALHGCLIRFGRPLGSKPLIEMLRVVYRRSFILSDNIVASIIRDHAISVGADDSLADWPLIMEICSVHPMPLTETGLANLVFGQINHEETREVLPTDKWSVQPDRSATIRHAVIQPIIEAFGLSRRLNSFVQMWSQQLWDTFGSEHGHIWSSISVYFARTATASMTQAQITEAVHNFGLDVVRMISTTSANEDTGRELHRRLVLLSAFIQSVRSESGLEQIQDLLDALWEALQNPADSAAIISSSKLRLEYTNLLIVVLRSWMPSWIARQLDMTSVEDLAVRLISSRTLRIVTDHLQNADKMPRIPAPTVVVSNSFLATICEVFMPYIKLKTPGLLIQKGLKYLTISGSPEITVLLEHSELLRAMLLSARESALVGRLEQVASVRDEVSEKQDLAPIASLVDLISGQEAGGLVCPPIEGLVQDLCTRLARNQEETNEVSLLSVLDSVPLSMVTAQHRTNVVDTITQLLSTRARPNRLAVVERRLASLVKWLEPGAPDAKVVTDAACIWNLARFPDVSEGQNQANSAALYDLVEQLTHMAFKQCAKIQERKHMQEIFIEHSKRAISCILELNSIPEPGSLADCASYAVAKVALLAMEKETNDTTKELLVHRGPEMPSTHLENLGKKVRLISSGTFEQLTDVRSMVVIFASMDTLVAIPDSMLRLNTTAKAAQEIIRHHHRQLTSYAHDILRAASSISKAFLNHADNKHETALWQRIIAKAHSLICQHATDDAQAIFHWSVEVLQLNPSVDTRAAILENLVRTIRERPTGWRKLLLVNLMSYKDRASETGLLLQRSIIRTLTKTDLDEDGFKPNINELLRRTIHVATGSDGLCMAKTAMQSCAIFLKEKPFIMDQFEIEEILTALHHIVSRPTLLSILYLDLTQVMTVLLTHYRPRLNGRFHLLVAVFQRLFSGIDRSSDQNSPRNPLAIRQARALARLLALFCDPPHLRHRNNPADLVDEGRKEKSRVGQFLSSILHHYCTQILGGRDGPEVREALNPGVWATIGAMESANPDGIRVLSAALNNSERAVLRSLHDDWKRFGKWEGL
jgi:nucleolar pre-ribosomal-associated protein 2